MWETSGMDETEVYTLSVGDRGRLVLPAPVRRRLGVEAGDRLIAIIDRDGVRLVSLREQVERMAGMFRDAAPDRSLVDELIAADTARRAAVSAADTLRAEQKAASKQVGSAAPDQRPALLEAAKRLACGY